MALCQKKKFRLSGSSCEISIIPKVCDSLTHIFFFNHLSHMCFVQEGEVYISLTIPRKRLCLLFITSRRFTLQTLQRTNKSISSECLPPTSLIIKHFLFCNNCQDFIKNAHLCKYSEFLLIFLGMTSPDTHLTVQCNTAWQPDDTAVVKKWLRKSGCSVCFASYLWPNINHQPVGMNYTRACTSRGEKGEGGPGLVTPREKTKER